MSLVRQSFIIGQAIFVNISELLFKGYRDSFPFTLLNGLICSVRFES